MISGFFWAEGMACAGVGEPLWDEKLDTKEPLDAERWRLHRARVICNRCPVTYRCLTYGVEHKQSGVWGAQLLADGRIQEFPTRPRREPEHRMSTREPIDAQEAHRDRTGYATAGDCT